MITRELILERLKQVKYPGFSRDIVAFGVVKNISIEGSDVAVLLSIDTQDSNVPREIFQQAHAVLDQIEGIGAVKIDIDLRESSARQIQGASTRNSIAGVKKIIAVASGKGGVGKSTVSANLAVALAAQGLRVGLCDCDLYGPSMGLMFGISGDTYVDGEGRLIPGENYGVKVISMAMLLEEDAPIVVRGPLATRYMQQLLREVAWGELDVLVLDLPPGTGDIQITLVQTVAIDGAVVVTTPQEMALIDARKAIAMFNKVNVPVMGIVENMSWFECPSDGKRYYLFGQGGGVREAEKLGVELLAQIPLQEQTRVAGDAGQPVAVQAGDMTNPAAQAFVALAAKLADR